MKNLIILSGFLILFSGFTFAQADNIKGYWLTEKKTSQVNIYKAENGKYYGRISWLEEPNENGHPKMDDENPDGSLKSRHILGLLLLQGFSYNPDDEEWEDGTIYDPDSGNTYDCYMWFEKGDNTTLKIKGYVLGIKFLGRETTWIREEKRLMKD